MEIVLWAAHLPRLATASVGQCEKVKQSVVHEPRKGDDLMRWVRLLQQKRRTPMIANEPSDLLSKPQIAAKIPKHAPTDFHADQRVLGDRKSTRLNSSHL